MEPETGFGRILEDGTKVFTNCTVGGPVFVYVKNGMIIRVTPIEFSSEDAESWVIEARNRVFSPPRRTLLAPYVLAARSRVYSPERTLHPLIREDFNPEGERNPENRGKSNFVKISWEEALSIITREIERLKRNYGPAAIAATTSSHYEWGNIGYRHSAFYRFFNLLGFTAVEHNPDSWEGWHWGAMHTWGFQWRLGVPEQYDLLEDALKHCEMIVYWSSDPDSTRAIGYQGYESAPWRQWLKDLGVKMVFIDPFYNYTAALFADKWFAPRPGTDAALALAIAYTWIIEDRYDKEYVATHTYGFDKFTGYVLGKDDGTPKTPKWAEKLTDVPAREIIALAREWSSKRTMLAAGGVGGWGGACRAAYGTEWARLMVCLAAMQGLGKPGVNIWGTTQGAPFNARFYFPGYAEGGIAGDPIKTGALYELLGRGMVKKPTFCSVAQQIPRLHMPECVLTPPVEWKGRGSIENQFATHRYPAPGYSEVKMLYRVGGSYIGTMTETNRWIKMYRSPKLEFVVNQTPWRNEPEAKFADIILPATTNFERWDISEWASCSGYIPHSSCGTNHRLIVLHMKCIEPLGDSKADYQIFAEIARRMGFYDEFTEGGMTDLDWVRRMFEVTDICKYISWEEFKKKGYFVVPLPKPYKPTPALRWFYEGRPRDTPDWGPAPSDVPINKLGLATPTGKIEFVSKSLERFDPKDEERPPLPRYIPSWEGHLSDLASKYPLQLITPHPRYSYHTHYDGKGVWVNEIPDHRVLKEDGHYYWVVRINPKDAKARGIRNEDIVRVFNDRGSVLCVAQVTERVRPGVVHSWESCNVYDPLGEPGDPKSVDRGGCLNILTPSRVISKNAYGMAPNSCLVEIEKWRG